MDVWDRGVEKTVLSQIKKLISRLYRGLGTSRYLLYPGILLIFVFILFSLLTGCASMQWPWKKDDDAIIVTDLPPREFICTKIDCGDEDIDELVADEQNTIACIKLQPECKVDEQN